VPVKASKKTTAKKADAAAEPASDAATTTKEA